MKTKRKTKYARGWTLAAVAVAHATILSSVHAAEVTLRLVRAESPQELVSTAVTDLSAEAEAAKAREAEEKAPLANMAKMGQPPPKPKDDEAPTRAEFDRYTNYMRGIVIDKTFPFFKAYQGSYLGRSDVIKIELWDGEHTIEPGAHKFSVKGDTISSSDPTLKITGKQIDVTVFPVTIMAVNGSAVRDLPAEVRRLPVSPRLFWGEEELLPREQYLSPSATFKRLTLYMLANTPESAYRLAPGDRKLQVTPQGVTILDDAGKPTQDKGAAIEDRFTVVLPQVSVPVSLRGDGLNLVISGPSGRLSAETPKVPPVATKLKKPVVLQAISSPGGAEITVGNRAAGEPMKFIGDVGEFPRRKIVIDATDPRSREPRVMIVSFSGYSVEAGKDMRVRVQSRDAVDAATITPTQVAAFIWHEPLLGDDGILANGPEGDGNDRAECWRSIRVSAADQPDWFDLQMPVLTSNVYRVRIVVGMRGEAGVMSPLHADFVEGVINPDAKTCVSVFCPVGRHAFIQGEEVPVSAVVKSTVPVPAGTLKVALEREGLPPNTLFEKPMPALGPGEHPVHLAINASLTAAMAAGDYKLTASLGAVVSNHWSVRLSRPRYTEAFAYFDVGWDNTANVDAGRQYVNVPHDIAQANEKGALVHRNAAIQALSDNVNFQDFSGGGAGAGLAAYQGRDSSSEVAEAEMILRQNLSLPAHEAYYYQNNFELMNEALASQGMAGMNELVCAFSPISLIHSVAKEVDAVNRQFQLTAQIARKFANFIGFAPNKELTIPTGNSEVVDQGRTVRLIEYEKQFVGRHGFTLPPNRDALDYFLAKVKGEKTTAAMEEAGKRWETWFLDLNNLQGEWYGFVKRNIEAIAPGMLIANLGPGWGDTFSGLYPPLSHKNQSPLLVQIGSGDFGEACMLDSFWQTKRFQMTGSELWGEQGMFGTAGPANLKQRMIAFIAAGAKGYGYRTGWSREAADPRDIHVMTWMKDRLDDAAFLREYGAMFRQTEPRGEVAIYYPFQQTMYEVMSPRVSADDWMPLAWYQSMSVLTELAFLGYNAELVTQEMIDSGEDLSRFKVLILPELHYSPEKYVKAMEKFAASGGTILAGSRTTLMPKGARKIDNDFMEVVETARFWGFNSPMDTALSCLLRETRRRLPGLKLEMEKSVKPFAWPATDRTFVQTSRAGDGRVTFVWNFSYPSWMGTTRVSGNTEWSAYHAEANESTLMPLRETVSFPADAVTYELVTRERITGEAKAGRIDATADLSQSPFRVFVSLPKEIKSLRIEAPEKASLGTHFSVTVSPLDAEGKEINASIPLRLTLVDQNGREVWRECGAALKSWRGTLSAPMGETAGEWKIIVEELVSGRRCEVALATLSAGSLPPGAAVRELALVDVQRPDLIKDFIAARKQDQAALLILLDEAQVATWKPVAVEAQKALESLGVKVQIKLTNEQGVFETADRVHLYRGWTEMKPGQFIDKHVVLIGGEGQSVLFEELQDSSLVPRPMTQSYPGKGRSFITLVRSAFAFNKDVLCFAGPDVEGVRAAVAKLADVAKGDAAANTVAQAIEQPVKTQRVDGTIVKGSPFASMDGAVIQQIACNEDGSKIAFGTAGYAKSVFMFDASGKPIFEDKIGHINTLGVTPLSGNGGIVVDSDGFSYLRKEDGSLAWCVKGVTYADPGGKYFVLPFARGFAVYDLSLKPIWQFDEWDKYETTMEILFARQAQFVTATDHGKSLIYRVSGREPGVAGKEGDQLVFADAMTGSVTRRAEIDVHKMLSMAGMEAGGGRPPVLLELTAEADAKWFAAKMGVDKPYGREADHRIVLLDQQLKPVQVEKFVVPTFIAGVVNKTNRQILADKRMVFTIGDTLCVSDTEWTALSNVRLSSLVLSMAVDEKSGRVAVSDYLGDMSVFDLSLKLLWRANVGGAAQLKWLPTGGLAVGTLQGDAMAFDAAGKKLWSVSLNRFAEPEAVEKRWTELEALPTIHREGQEPWWERVAKSVPIGEDVAKLTGTVKTGSPLAGKFEGQPFGTYLVEWTASQASGSQELSLEIAELEAGDKDMSAARTPRVTQSSRTGVEKALRHAVLCLGDKPQGVEITVRGAGTGEAQSSVSVRPVLFPSGDLVRIPMLYRGVIPESVRANPPADVVIYTNFDEFKSGEGTMRVDPFQLIDGRRIETQKGLKQGRWWGDGSNPYQLDNSQMQVPCWVELTLPRKQIVTHIAIIEDPTLPRAETVAIDAYVEARENRQGLTEFEKRQLARGFYINVAKHRGNDSHYNVYKLDKPVFTRKLRVYVLEGATSINEIEVYGGLEKKPIADAAGGK